MKINKRKWKINKEMLLHLVADLMIVIGILGIMFNFGRCYQKKKDQQYCNDYSSRYYKLLGEYNYYKANSYVLYGEQYYKDRDLLPN